MGDGAVMKLLLVPWKGSPHTPAANIGTAVYHAGADHFDDLYHCDQPSQI
jgi:hypothetical protein